MASAFASSLRFEDPPQFDAVASMLASGARTGTPSPASSCAPPSPAPPPSPAASPPRPVRSSSSGPSDATPACFVHPRHPVLFYCGECRSPACVECVGTGGPHEGHRGVAGRSGGMRERLGRAQGEAQAALRGAASGLEATEETIATLLERARNLQEDVDVVFNRLQTALDKRRSSMMRDLDLVASLKEKSMRENADGVRRAAAALRTAMIAAANALAGDVPPDPATTIRALTLLERALAVFRSAVPFPELPAEDACIAFVRPEAAALAAFGSVGEIRASCSARRSHMVLPPGPPRTRSALVNHPFEVRYRLINLLERPTDDGKESVKVTVVGPGEGDVAELCTENGSMSSSEGAPGEGRVIFRPARDGLHRVHIRVHGCDIVGSPLVVAVATSRNYANLDTPVLVFGKDGPADGELCRPWGIACTLRGNLVVADRSNNRIQVFDSKGNFLFNFGKHGAEPGEFDRPAGVTVDRRDRIVVADKDNHRIQVFTSNGRFLLVFGSRGYSTGQFQYPWDVASDHEGRIAVSDTRNHRVQLFSSEGVFLTRFGWDGAQPNAWKSFDSPRGLVFTPKGELVVTDFNNHRAVTLSLRRKGDGTLEFIRGYNINGDVTRGTDLHRPQGITLDHDGNILIADSRHNRVSVFNSKGGYVTHFGVHGKELGQMDRPSGICVLPDGLVAVVDFGNTRIQLF